MKQYIDKTTVVAQANIEITNLRIAEKEGFLTEYGRGMLEGLEGIVDFINTLEVKEVDLEKEIHKFIDKEELHLRLWDVDRIAKHFYELGLKVQKGE